MNKVNKKAIIIIIIILIVIFIILALIGIFKRGEHVTGFDTKKRLNSVLVSTSLIDDSTRVKQENLNLGETCESGICVDYLTVNAYENEGLIEFSLSAQEDMVSEGYMKLIINGQDLIFYHGAVTTSENTTGYFGYDGFDFRNITSYSLQFVPLEGYENIID